MTVQLDRLYKVREVAEHFGVNPKTVYTWLEDGRLGCYQPNQRLIRISERHLREFKQAREITATRKAHR